MLAVIYANNLDFRTLIDDYNSPNQVIQLAIQLAKK